MNSLAVRIVRIVGLVAPTMGMLFLLAAPLRAQDAPALFKSKCAACHGPDGSGNVPMGKTLGVTDLKADDGAEANGRAVDRQHHERQGHENAGVQGQADGRSDQRTGRLHPRPGEKVAGRNGAAAKPSSARYRQEQQQEEIW